jgi:hypothetical protein
LQLPPAWASSPWSSADRTWLQPAAKRLELVVAKNGRGDPSDAFAIGDLLATVADAAGGAHLAVWHVFERRARAGGGMRAGWWPNHEALAHTLA